MAIIRGSAHAYRYLYVYSSQGYVFVLFIKVVILYFVLFFCFDSQVAMKLYSKVYLCMCSI